MLDRRSLLASLAALSFSAWADERSSRIEGGSFESAALKGPLNYSVYLPASYAGSEQRLPVVYLLHGRGDSMSDWWRCKALLDELIASGRIPPLIAVMPDASWSRRGGYYVDSAQERGYAIETALTTELLPHIDARYRTLATRDARIVAGYSMGGYGAMRYALAHPLLFSAALVMSPAVYTPLPPRGSSVREFGGFGRGKELFVDEIYRAKNYPALLDAFVATGLRSRFFILSGDDEYRNPDPAEAENDIDLEAHKLYKRLARVNKSIQAELRIVDGGHDWAVWLPGLREGLLHLLGPAR